ncbi:hypothetical protein QYM36_018957, partial [Artemia franciscana]
MTKKPSAFSEDGRVLLPKMSEHGKKIVASSARLSRSQASKGKKTKQQTDFAKSTDLALSVVDAARALKAKNGLNPVQTGIGLQRFDVRETVLRFEQFLLNHSAPFLANIELWMVLVTIGFNQIGVKQEHQWKGFCYLLTQM